MIHPTDEEARAADRAAIAHRDAERHDGMHQCPGYPLDHYCMADIPWTQTLCRFCQGTRAIFQAGLHRAMTAIPSVGEILQDVPIPEAPVKLCECGGDANAPYHEASLTHLRWKHA